jgi:hypothetical protein
MGVIATLIDGDAVIFVRRLSDRLTGFQGGSLVGGKQRGIFDAGLHDRSFDRARTWAA